MQRLRQIVAQCTPYFIRNAHGQMNSGTHYGSLLLTACARKHVSAELFITIYTQIINLYSAKGVLWMGGRLPCLLFLVDVLKDDLSMSFLGDSSVPEDPSLPTASRLCFPNYCKDPVVVDLEKDFHKAVSATSEAAVLAEPPLS